MKKLPPGVGSLSASVWKTKRSLISDKNPPSRCETEQPSWIVAKAEKTVIRSSDFLDVNFPDGVVV